MTLPRYQGESIEFDIQINADGALENLQANERLVYWAYTNREVFVKFSTDTPTPEGYGSVTFQDANTAHFVLTPAQTRQLAPGIIRIDALEINDSGAKRVEWTAEVCPLKEIPISQEP